MQKITTFLTFNDQAEEAANLYTSLFKNSKIPAFPGMEKVHRLQQEVSCRLNFKLDGQEFFALNGGSHFKFSDGISLFVDCKTQEEVDLYWETLSEGGEKGPCGWLKDKFGVSWQIVPSALGQMLGDKDPEKSQRVMQAMLKMSKLDIPTLEQAYQG